MRRRFPTPTTMMRSASSILFVLVAGGATLAAGPPLREQIRQDFDIRIPADPRLQAGFVMRSPTVDQRARYGEMHLAAADLVLRWDGMSAAPRWIVRRSGQPLSAPRAADPATAARGFLEQRAALFGLSADEVAQLRLTGVVPAPGAGAHIYFSQEVSGLEVFGGRVLANVRSDGAVTSVGAGLYAVSVPLNPPAIDATQAVRLALADVYPELAFDGEVQRVATDATRRTVFSGAGFGRAPQAQLVVFPEAAGAARLAWEVHVSEPSRFTDYQLLFDAFDGALLLRRNRTRYASARIVQGHAPLPRTEEYAPTNYERVAIPASTPQSPSGWIAAAGVDLEGNNATSHLGLWTAAGLADPAGVYDYPFNSLRSALVNSWYWANDVHDRFYAAGFDEAHGNYQTDNFGQGGTGGDAMAVVQWVNGGRDNAFYTSSVDGDLSTINFFPTTAFYAGDHDGYPENGGDRNMGFMRDVIAHEYGHGVSIRLVGGPADDSCLFGRQSGAMGEGWSDVFSAMFYDDPQIGDHWFEGAGWLRDLRHDVSYDDFCGVGDRGCQVHSDGMIWGAALWDLRRSMIALDPTAGRVDFERLVIEGLASTPCDPTMVDARDGLLAADTTLFSGAHQAMIWNAFAARGIGENASSSGDNDSSPNADFTVPAAHACTAPGAPTGLTAVAEGSNAIRLDYTAGGASAVELWRSDADNPFDRPRRIDSTDSTSTRLDDTVQGGKTYDYHLVALGAGGATCRSTVSGSATATASGSCQAFPILAPGLVISDGDPGCALTLNWSAASAGCIGQPVIYNIYRGDRPGFTPNARLAIGRTTATTFIDIPPQDGATAYYLVTAQHGTAADPADHSIPGRAQLLKWAAGLPALSRTTVQSWDFDAGDQGWTVDNGNDPGGAWTRVQPTGTLYGDALFAPDEAAGGSGLAWVTGDTGSPPSSITETDADGSNSLASPVWDGTGGATLLSFDFWQQIGGLASGGIEITVSNGNDNATFLLSPVMTSQRFETAGRHGWQRAEVDLADHVTPTATMSVVFSNLADHPLSEFGIDNVQVDQAGVCGRSALDITAVTVDDTAAGWGNGNGVLEPGETARLGVGLINNGTTTATLPVGRLVRAPAGVSIHEPDDAFPTLNASATGVSQGNGFTVTLTDTAVCDEAVTFEFEFVDAAGTRSLGAWSLEYGSTITETIFADDFETDKSWIVSGAAAGAGQWTRADPVGTLNGSEQANPEDCADGPSTLCYVTENGPVAGDPNDHDIDADAPELCSPLLDFSGYKRTRLNFDLWFYDDSSSTDFFQDYNSYGVYTDDGLIGAVAQIFEGGVTAGWEPRSLELTDDVPNVADVRVAFQALDRDSSFYSGAADHVVELGVDNVLLSGDRQVCAALGIDNTPNGIGNTLRVDLVGGVDVTVWWTASPTDASHDAAAYYRLYVSNSAAAGFSIVDTTTSPGVQRAPQSVLEFYEVTAVNSAGESAD